MESTTSEEIVWRKSSFSNVTGECIEVARTDRAVLVRDSKRPDGAVLSFSHKAWDAFKVGVKDGQFD
ncbi:DUF397 domain-containing protein [Nonomuraea sp. NPDC059194]|uniref:DUF397 domain-containing protein n=1 Tax=Nonomuraea sp. NPDC059194 TaxID=3346764 RepID=UPI0036910B52